MQDCNPSLLSRGPEGHAEVGQIQETAGFDANPPTRRIHESVQEKRIRYNPSKKKSS